MFDTASRSLLLRGRLVEAELAGHGRSGNPYIL
jgi:hypothetical protein